MEGGDTICHADETEEELSSFSITFNESPSEGAKVLFDRVDETADMRTVTVITDPGTADEKTCIASVPKREKVMIQKEKEWKFYKNYGCTIEAPMGKDTGNETVYLKTK